MSPGLSLRLQCWKLSAENQDREINGLFDAMDFFNTEEGEILTYDSEDVIITKGKRINVTPAWKWAEGNLRR